MFEDYKPKFAPTQLKVSLPTLRRIVVTMSRGIVFDDISIDEFLKSIVYLLNSDNNQDIKEKEERRSTPL